MMEFFTLLTDLWTVLEDVLITVTAISELSEQVIFLARTKKWLLSRVSPEDKFFFLSLAVSGW